MTISLTWTPAGGAAIALDKPDYALQDYHGFGGVETDVRTIRAPYQHGATLVAAHLAARAISLDLWALADTTAALQQRRQALAQAFSPLLGLGVLRAARTGLPIVEIAAIPDGAPAFGTARLRVIQQAAVDLLAPDPFWYSATPVEATFTAPESIIVTNTGDVPAPFEAVFHGPSVNPVLQNLTTGVNIVIQHTLVADEEIIVITGPGAPRVIRVSPTGVESSGMHLVQILGSSDFFVLGLGATSLRYTVESGAGGMDLTFKHLYVGI